MEYRVLVDENTSPRVAETPFLRSVSADHVHEALSEGVDDVADDLENYLETTEGAEGFNAKIEQTDKLIEEIVYELYGLTDEEIEIVE